MQPRIQLAFWAARARCWLMLSFSSISTPKSCSLGLLSSHSPPSLYLCLGLPRPMCRTLHLTLLNFMRFTQAHLSRPVQVPLNGIPSLQRINHTTQLGVVGKLAEGALGPTVHVTDKDIKHHRPQYQPLRHITCHWSPPGHRATDCNSVSASIKPVPYPASGPSVKSLSLQFRDKDIMWDSVKCLAQVHVDDVSCPSFVHQHCNPIIQGYQVGQAQFALGEAMLAFNMSKTIHPNFSTSKVCFKKKPCNFLPVQLI